MSLLAASFGLWLDAGDLASPVLDGFTRLHAEGCDDERVSWKVKPKRTFVNREPDPLSLDHIQGGVLQLDLAPGTWRLFAMVGQETLQPGKTAVGGPIGLKVDGTDHVLDAVPEDWEDYLASEHHVRNLFPVFREGETEWDRVVKHRHRFRHVDVEVGDAPLEVAALGRPLQALIAIPWSAYDEHDVIGVLDTIEQARRVWYHDRQPQAEVWTLPSTAADALSVQVARPGQWPDASQASVEPGIRGAVAPGETLRRILWIFPGSGETWFSSDADVATYQVHWQDASGVGNRVRRPRPTLLRPTDGVLMGGTGAPMGLAVAIDQPTTGSITLEHDWGTLTVPIEVRRRDVELARHAPTGFFLNLRRNAIGRFGMDSDEVKALFDQDAAMMREYGFELLVLRNTHFPYDQGTPDLLAWAERWAAAGGTWITFPGASQTTRHFYYTKDDELFTPEMRDELAEYRLDESPIPAPVFMFDEESHKRARGVEKGQKLARDYRRNGAKLLAGAAPSRADQEIAGSLDFVLLGYGPDMALDREAVERVRRKGSAPWMYWSVGASGPWVVWALGIEGHAIWNWNDNDSDPSDLVRKRTPWFQSVLAPDGTLWPTVQLWELAEGMTDARYLRTLEQTRPSDPVVRGFIASARAAFDGASMELPLSAPYDGDAVAPRHMQAMREHAARLLEDGG